jgi:hypothetical protein
LRCDLDVPLHAPPELKKPVLSDSGLVDNPSKELEFVNRIEVATHSIDASIICSVSPPRYRKPNMSLDNVTHDDECKKNVTSALTSFTRRISMTGKAVTVELLVNDDLP